jgi:type VI secretion system secreted protein VgrG
MSEPLLPFDGYVLSLPESPSIDAALVELRLSDAIDELFALDLWLDSTASELRAADFVGRPLSIDMPAMHGVMRVRGVIAELHQHSAEPTGVSRYRLRAHPWLWLTTQRRNCRIFQHHSVPALIHALCASSGAGIPPCTAHLSTTPQTFEYQAQYNESDWALLRRRASDVGLSLCALHDGSGSMMLSDDLAAFAARMEGAIPYKPSSELLGMSPHVSQASFDTVLSPSASQVRDYDHRRPLLDLVGRAFEADPLASEAPLEHYEHRVGRFDTEAGGAALARLWLEQARSRRERATFLCSHPAAPGTILTLSGHPRSDANIDWLVVAARTRATSHEAAHEVDAIPLQQPHRPARLSPPRIIGMQTAVVVGAPGEEIDVDSEGRVCVRFRWDRRDQLHDTTRRVRVAQGWAGPGYGLVCLPRVGDEVIVEFLDGDADQPLIVGRVHNGINPSPLVLPDHKAHSTWRSRSTPGGDGFNEITLDDLAGSERIYVHAQRDAVIEVNNDVHADVGGHVQGLVRGNASGGVKGSGSMSIDGDASLRVGGDLTVEASAIRASASGDIVLAAGDERIDESTNHRIRTGGLYVNGKSVIQLVTPHFHVFSSDIKLTAGGSSITLGPGGISIDSDGPVVVNGSVIKLN